MQACARDPGWERGPCWGCLSLYFFLPSSVSLMEKNKLNKLKKKEGLKCEGDCKGRVDPTLNCGRRMWDPGNERRCLSKHLQLDTSWHGALLTEEVLTG